MAPGADRFFDDEQHEASRLKVVAYANYLRPFAYKVLHYYPRLWLIDGFAGAGRYGAQAGYAEGSALAAARFAHQYNVDHASSTGGSIGLINVEKDPDTFDRLQFNLGGFGPVATNLQGRFQDRLEEILRIVGHAPALFFIDPFGMEGADVRLVEQILRERGGGGAITELLIHFSDRALVRIAGNLAAHTKTPRGARAAQTKVAHLDAILGTSWWRGAFANPELSAEQRCDLVAELYMQQLRNLGIRFVHELRMRDAYDAAPRYRLVFTSRSAHGSYLMSDIAAGHEAELFRARFEGTFELDWQRQRRTDRRSVLRDEIHDWGLARRIATPEEVYLHFAPEYFGEWRTSDYDVMLRELVELGGIDRRTSTGIKRNERLRFVPTLQQSLFGALDDGPT
jgi:three-Cys-motif partner protein